MDPLHCFCRAPPIRPISLWRTLHLIKRSQFIILKETNLKGNQGPLVSSNQTKPLELYAGYCDLRENPATVPTKASPKSRKWTTQTHEDPPVLPLSPIIRPRRTFDPRRLARKRRRHGPNSARFGRNFANLFIRGEKFKSSWIRRPVFNTKVGLK